MIIQRMMLAALFALPLAACQSETGSEVGYKEGTYQQGAVADESARVDEPVMIDEDIKGEVVVDEDLVEDRSAGVYRGNDAEMND